MYILIRSLNTPLLPHTSSSALLYSWLPLTYLFVHLVLIMILLWAAHNKESAVAVIIVS